MNYSILIPKWIPRFGREKKKLVRMLEAARLGKPWAIKKCESLYLDVWTQEQIDALNYYINVKNDLSNNGRMKHPGKISLTRVSQMGKLHEADVLWIQGVDKGYYLICVQFDDGILALWICMFMSKLFQPICDVTRWSEYDYRGEEVL